jgi:hypothetical protein
MCIVLSCFLAVKKINLVSARRKHKILEENTYDHTVTNVSEKINEACGIKKNERKCRVVKI